MGRYTVEALEREGQEVVVVARSRGVDVTTGAGLDGALAGVESVVDATNTTATDPAAARKFFGTTTEHLWEAEQRAGVGITSSCPSSEWIGARATLTTLASGVRKNSPWPALYRRPSCEPPSFTSSPRWSWAGPDGAVAIVPPLLVQPVAASDVGRVLAQIATAPPQGRAPDLAGPEPQDLIDMARRSLAVRGESVCLVPSWRDGPFGVEMAGEVLLPGPGSRVAPTTFDAWLAKR